MRSLCLALFFSFFTLTSESEEEPNILLIFADDIGYEALGSYGGLDFKTPHLDRMAAEGLRFTRAYTSPVCTPSRVSLHTGLITNHHGHTGVLPVHLGTKKKVDFEKMPTFARALREDGYATSVTGKWQLATLETWPDHIRSAGFDSWCVWQIWLEGEKTERHWGPVYNHDGKIREDVSDRFGPDVLTEYVIGEMKSAQSEERPFFILHNELLPHYPMIDTPLDRELGREKSLDHMIEYMDRLVGQLLDAVEDMGIRENTYVLFMGDNGTEESYFQNPKAGKPGEDKHTRHTEAGRVNGGKKDLNDAGTHVPLLVWGPQTVPQGAVCDDLVDVIDLFPTFLDLAAVETEASSRRFGQSLKPQFHGKPGTARTWTHQGLSHDQTLFDGSWRLFRKSGKLIDARKLPVEKIVETETTETKAARERLEKIFEEISR
ncbi:MAG: sulfatase-like hydrolase/transferase [Verrucomicrobiales bacterium]|nr:sulfatase-like hydrolase/transferase [Verrucomicrobiales bacterium]